MTISHKKIAEAILTRRNSLAAEQVEAELKRTLSREELQEAKNLRWLIADTDSGTLAINYLPKVVEAIKAAADLPEKPVQESVEPSSPARKLMVELLEAQKPVYTRTALREAWLPLCEDDNAKYAVGDAVVVGQDGQNFSGTISEKLPTGEYKVSFGEKKPKAEKTYKTEELNKVDKDAKSVQPETKATSLTQPAVPAPAAAGV